MQHKKNVDESKGNIGIVDFLFNLFGRFWALWGLVSFVISFLLIFLPSMVAYLIPGKKGQDYFIWVSRCWMRTWLYLVACPVTVEGKENFKKEILEECLQKDLLDEREKYWISYYKRENLCNMTDGGEGNLW